MIFWHAGLTTVIIFMTLGKRSIDYRIVLLGSILPDLIDKPIGRIFFKEELNTSHLFGHTLIFVTALMLGIQLTLRGKTARRWFILPIAALIHLVLDGMWGEPVTLFWPLFGAHFPVEPSEGYWLESLLRLFREPVEGLKELAGLLLVLYFGWAYELHRPDRFKEFLRTGSLREPVGVESKSQLP